MMSQCLLHSRQPIATRSIGWSVGGVNAIGKEHFTSLYSPAREKAFITRNISAGIAATGLFPLNPDIVLRSMSKVPVEVAIATGDDVEVRVVASLQEVVLQKPVTPVSVEALMSLQNMMLQDDAQGPDEPSKKKLGRHLQKLVKAAQVSAAKSIFQEDQIQLLTTVNNEAKFGDQPNL